MRWNVRATLLAALLVAGCDNERAADIVGTECLPESIPTTDGVAGYSSTETYLESAKECGHHPCIVHRLFNGTEGTIPADPTLLCDADHPAPGCVEASAVAASVHCTCRCAGADEDADYCTCPENFVCRQVLTTGPKDEVGSYCTRRPTSR